MSGSSPDEFCSSDEVKVFKDEGEDESEQNASECLQAELLEEEKSSLIKESEQVRGCLNIWILSPLIWGAQAKIVVYYPRNELKNLVKMALYLPNLK